MLRSSRFRAILAGLILSSLLASPSLPMPPVITRALDGHEAQRVSVGETITLEGVLDRSTSPIGYPGPILKDLDVPLFEVLPGGGSIRISMLLLIIPPGGTPTPDLEDPAPITRARVTGQYTRFLGAPTILVTEIIIDGSSSTPSIEGGASRLQKVAETRAHAFVRGRLPVSLSASVIRTRSATVASPRWVAVEVDLLDPRTQHPIEGRTARLMYVTGDDEIRLLAGDL